MNTNNTEINHESLYMTLADNTSIIKTPVVMMDSEKNNITFLKALFQEYSKNGLADSKDGKAVKKLFDQTKTKIENAIAKKERELNSIKTASEYPYYNLDKILNHSANTRKCVEDHGISIRYNELLKDVEITFPHKEFHAQTRNSSSITALKDLMCVNKIPYVNIEEHVLMIAGDNAFHPVRDYLLGLNWDGVSRIDDVFNTLTLSDGDKDFAKMLLRKWLIMCATSVIKHKGVSQQGVLTLVGKQGIGKTSWIKSLVPNQDWVTTDMTINPGDKDDVIKFVKNWIVELGELDATFRKADIAALKGFITRDVDEFRAPFGKKSEKYPRQTSFYGSVNEIEFLQDEENRRFWPIHVSKINFKHDIDINQLWAEVVQLVHAGEIYWLTDDERATLHNHNKVFKTSCVVGELAQSKGILNPVGTDLNQSYMNCTEILLYIGYKQPTKSDSIKLAKFLRESGYYLNTKTRKWTVFFSDQFQNDGSCYSDIKKTAKNDFSGFAM